MLPQDERAERRLIDRVELTDVERPLGSSIDFRAVVGAPRACNPWPERQRNGAQMTAEELVQALGLAPHPEGGWYRETWRAESELGQRASASAVLYVIEPGQRSHWNRVDADEIWLWHGGDSVDISIAGSDSGAARTVRLGGNVEIGEQPQFVIPANLWQSAVPVAGGKAGYTLISCIVAPAFEYSGFELAPPDWTPRT